jgi:hypothetical protein
MHPTLSELDTKPDLMGLLLSEFPEGSKPSMLPRFNNQFRAQIEAPEGAVTIVIPRRTLAALDSSRFDNERVLNALRRFIRERLQAATLRHDVVAVWDYAEAA